MFGIEIPETETTDNVATIVYSDCGEGPFNTREEAVWFLHCEVGATGARVYELTL